LLSLRHCKIENYIVLEAVCVKLTIIIVSNEKVHLCNWYIYATWNK